MGSKKKRKELKRQAKLKEQETQKASKKTNSFKITKKHSLILSVILLINTIAFLPSLNNSFVNWDDDKNFYENELITTINDNNFWENSKKIFTTPVIGNYNPLTIWTFAVEKKLFGFDKPYYWHLNNLILHSWCVLFVFLICLRLKLNIWGASICALLFAIHPMRVESVAWLTERKDVLFSVFYLLAMYQYIKGKQEGFKKKDIAIIAIAFILSLFSKIQAVILPISLILVDYYLSKTSKITFKSIFNKAPLFAGSLLFGLLGIYFLKDQGSIDQQAYYGIQRLFIGSYGLSVYYFKSLVPYELSPLYPYPSALDYRFYVSFISFIATGLLLWFSYFRKWKVIFFGLSFFIVNVFLLLQILGAGQGFLADRFTYIPYFGLFFIFSYYISKFIKDRPQLKTPVLGATALVLAVYGFMTFQQCKIWEHGGTLWTHVLKYYNKTTLPWGNRANFHRDAGMVKEALADYSAVIRLKPDKPEPYNSRARLYFNFNHPDSLSKALFNYNKAIELKPSDVEYRVNRGATFAKLNNMQMALQNLNEAEQLDPTFANIYLNRSIIHNQTGNYTNALLDVDKYLNLKPNYPDMWYEKSRLHNALRQGQEAIQAINTALSMQQKGLYYFERAKAYYLLQNINAAKQDILTSQKMGFNGNPQFANRILNS